MSAPTPGQMAGAVAWDMAKARANVRRELGPSKYKHDPSSLPEPLRGYAPQFTWIHPGDEDG